MTVIVENSNESTTVVDLPHLSANFPPALAIEVARDNIVNTLRNLVADSVYAATIEGPEGIGKTTVLSQFVRRYNTTAVSIFLTAANRLSYDPDLIRTDISVQVHWLLNGEVLDSSRYGSALLKSYYADLQRLARQRRTLIYFVVDGLEELDSRDRDSLVQALADILPLGIPQFRFFFPATRAFTDR